jgi:hypothetical protein
MARSAKQRSTTLTRLSIDFENPSKTWWQEGGQDLWDAITEGFDGNSVVLDDRMAESWLCSAREISGWAEGPDYAPHPITAAEVDEVEVDF